MQNGLYVSNINEILTDLKKFLKLRNEMIPQENLFFVQCDGSDVFDEKEFTPENIQQLTDLQEQTDTTIYFARINAEEGFVSTICNILKRNKKALLTLQLESGITDESFAKILNALQDNKDLDDITIRDNHYLTSKSIKTLTTFLANHSQKIRLTLESCPNLGGEAMHELAVFVQRHGCIKSLTLISQPTECNKYLCGFMEGKSILSSLFVDDDIEADYQVMDNTSIRALFNALAKNNTLHKLAVLVEFLDEETLMVIKNALTKNNSLRYLTIHGSTKNNLLELLKAVESSSSIHRVYLQGRVTAKELIEIADIIKSNTMFETLGLVLSTQNEDFSISYQSLQIALEYNKVLLSFDLTFLDKHKSHARFLDIKAKQILARNSNINKIFREAKQDLTNANNLSEPPIFSDETIAEIIKHYENAISLAKKCLAEGYPKAAFFIDECYLAYARFLLRIDERVKAFDQLNLINCNSAVFKEAQYEKANFFLNCEMAEESDQEKHLRMQKALAIIPDLYNENVPNNFKQIFLQLMQLTIRTKLTIKPNLTWQEIENIDPITFCKVSLDIEVLKGLPNQSALIKAEEMILKLKNKIIKLKETPLQKDWNEISKITNKRKEEEQKVATEIEEDSDLMQGSKRQKIDYAKH